MILAFQVSRQIGSAKAVAEGTSTAVLDTHCLYPSNDTVQVFVEGKETEFRVHDGGGAVTDSGVSAKRAASIIRPVVRNQGLHVTSEGEIVARNISRSQLNSAIILVANASKESAHFLVQRSRPKVHRIIRPVVERSLTMLFPDRWSDKARVSGLNKPHKFDYLVNLTGDRRLIMDVVVPELGSINAAFVSHWDVAQLKSEFFDQIIVFDDGDEWKSNDLALLDKGARLVPLQGLESALSGFASA